MQRRQPDRLRILMVAPQPFFRPRGTPFSVLHRVQALTRLGHRVDLVTYPFGDTPEVEGLRVHRTARIPGIRDVRIGPSIAKLLLDIPVLRRALQMARGGRFDLVHTHEEAGAMGAWIRRRWDLPHLYDMHSSLPQQFATFDRWRLPGVVPLFDRLERFTLDWADGVITVCPALQEHVMARGYEGSLAMIENSFGSSGRSATDAETRALRHELGLGDDPVVVYSGTLEPYQGLDLLVEAAGAVRKRVSGARVLVVGGRSEQVRKLQHQVDGAGLSDAFRLIGAVAFEDVHRYQALADVLVTCRTRGTNTPLKLYEYLRSRRPIVATDMPSHTQVLSAETAQLVAPEPDAIAAGIVRVLTDAEHAASLAENAYSLAVQRYSDEAYVDSLQGIVRDTLLAARRRREAA